MRKIIFNLGSKKYEDNKNSTCKLNYLQNSLLMSIVDNPEKNVSTFNRKIDKRKIGTSSIMSSSALFYFLVHVIYNIVHYDQNKHIMLESYINGINTSILLKKHYENIFSEKLVNELHSCIENIPRAINYPNVKDSLFVKINGTLVNK